LKHFDKLELIRTWKAWLTTLHLVTGPFLLYHRQSAEGSDWMLGYAYLKMLHGVPLANMTLSLIFCVKQFCIIIKSIKTRFINLEQTGLSN